MSQAPNPKTAEERLIARFLSQLTDEQITHLEERLPTDELRILDRLTGAKLSKTQSSHTTLPLPLVVYADVRAKQGRELILNLGDKQPIGFMTFKCKDLELANALYCNQLRITLEHSDPPINPDE